VVVIRPSNGLGLHNGHKYRHWSTGVGQKYPQEALNPEFGKVVESSVTSGKSDGF